jgi:hypothetical protein
MNTEEIQNKVDILLDDKGLTKGGEEQAVRQLLFHLYTAIDTYRYMTQAEKDAAGRWYRTFKTSFTLRNFLKERKRHRERKNPPCTPLIRKDSLEKAQKTLPPLSKNMETVGKGNLKERQRAFWAELEPYCSDRGGNYKRKTVLKFFYHWAQEVKKTGTMRWENETAWTTEYALAGWSKKPFETYDEAAELRLERTKAKSTQKESPLCTAEREDANERLFRQIEENKKAAVTREEWLRMKETQNVKHEGNAEIGTGA